MNETAPIPPGYAPQAPIALPTPPEALMARLSALDIPFRLYHHPAVFTVEESEYLKADIPGLHVKNLFLKDKRGCMALVTLPHEIQLDLKAVAPAIGLDRISFGSPERLFQHLGVTPGSVCPFAAVNDTQGQVRVVLHKDVAEAPLMSAHPMLNTMTVTLSGADLLRFLRETGHEPLVLDLATFARAA